MKRVSRMIGGVGLVMALILGQGSARATGGIGAGDVVTALHLAEPLIPVRVVSAGDRAELDRLIADTKAVSRAVLLEYIEQFIEDHPRSPFRVSLEANLGFQRVHEGYLSKGIASLTNAWELGRNARGLAVEALVDRAVGELLITHARLGHDDAVEKLLEEIAGRPMRGSSDLAISTARDSLWQIRQEPQSALRCGAMALNALLQSLRPDSIVRAKLAEMPVDPRGMSLTQIAQLAAEQGVTLMPVRASRKDATVPVPAIVHWKVGHYGAVLARSERGYLIEDPVFGGRKWISADALQTETSGNLLVSAESAGWERLAVDQADAVRGAGYTSSDDPLYTGPEDEKECNDPCGSSPPPSGMPVAAVHSMLVSLNIVDRPVGYTPPKGPDVDVILTYNQKDKLPPAVPTYSNLGPKWTFNWLSYIEDDPTAPGNSVNRYIAGGGGRRYSGYNATSGAFTPEKRSGAQLVRTSATAYELRYADGSKEIFAAPDGSTGFPRKVFLTQRIDEAGNAVTLQYDAQRRVTRITDAIGQATTLQYTNANPLLITGITDPFGRTATMTYDPTGRLSSIKDAVNLTSSFTYDAGTFITAMTTPYGTTGFAYGEGADRLRWLETTDPLGNKTRVEFRHSAPYPFHGQTPPTGDFRNNYFDTRNTYYWDQTAFKAPAGPYGIYPNARVRHWVHRGDNGSETDGVLESIKYPLENQIWYKYPGQSDTAFGGTFDKPRLIAQTQPDGSVRLEQIEYNPIGKVTRYVNPLGHEMVYEYDTNQIDLLRIKRRRISTDPLETFAQYTYNAQHRVLTFTDAAGGIWRYTYNAAGQLASEITPANETTSYTYDAKGYLTAVVNPRTQTAVTYTYDAVGRVNRRTDSQGAVQFAYDNLDRLVTTTYPDLTTETNTYNKLDIVSSKDRAGRVTTFTYDAVRNLKQVTYPAVSVPPVVPPPGSQPIVNYTYFENRLPKTVTDARGGTTTWTRDIQGRVLTEVSLDRGTTTYTYDVVGNLATKTDARGKTTTYTYDKLQRVTKELYADAIASTFAYDGTTNGDLGRLTAASGVGGFKYDARGLLIEQTTGDGSVVNPLTPSVTTVNGVPTVSWSRPVRRPVVGGWPLVKYTYTTAGRLASMTYPSGKVVTYTYTGGVVTNVAVNGTSVLRNITYTPLGAITGGTWGSNVLFRRSYDQNYRISAYDLNVAARSLAYDANGNLTSLTDSLSPALNTTYKYDTLNRLAQELRNTNGSTVDLGFTYDKNDNRLTSRTGATTYSLAYTTGASRLLSETGPTARSYTYDAAGNVASDTKLSYGYDGRGRLITAHKLPVTTAGVSAWSSYTYNAFGQMRSRNGTSDGGVRDFVYDPDGKLLGDYLGSNQQETVWLGDMPIALLSGTSTIQYIHADHLNTPRAISDTTGKVLWRWDSDAFGNGLPNEDVDGNGVKVTYNLRFPGQYYDGGTGKHYNYFRDYDPVTGRYLQSDPIGIEGGLNTYAYVGGNPLAHSDEEGLLPGRKGERGRTAKPEGTQNPGKKYRFDPDKNRYFFKDPDGKKRYKSPGFKPPGVKPKIPGFVPFFLPYFLDELCRTNPADPACNVWEPEREPTWQCRNNGGVTDG